MSQSPGRFSAPVKLSCAPPSKVRSRSDNALPSYLRRHIQLGFTQDDVAALISSIDSSQAPPSSSNGNPTLAHLPAELLLQILEHVPVDHILDWRLVCRGFRDALDGRVLYHCLQRTRLVGYTGPRHGPFMEDLDEEEHEAVHLLEAGFLRIEEDTKCLEDKRPIWSNKHAVFKIKEEWYRAFRTMCGLETKPGDTINDVEPRWYGVLGRLALLREEEQFGQLRWCIRLDHAVLDLDFPLDKDRLHFDFNVDLRTGLVRVAWKDMLVRFLKTERALRILMEQVCCPPHTSLYMYRSPTNNLTETRLPLHILPPRRLPPRHPSRPPPRLPNLRARRQHHPLGLPLPHASLQHPSRPPHLPPLPNRRRRNPHAPPPPPHSLPITLPTHLPPNLARHLPISRILTPLPRRHVHRVQIIHVHARLPDYYAPTVHD